MAASLRDLRRKIKSIRGTQKITSAMQLVAASKMQRAVRQATEARPYAERIEALLGQVAPAVNPETQPLFAVREQKNILVLLVTTNRGLAGALNTQLIRYFLEWQKQHQAVGRTIRVVAIGAKGRNYLLRYASDQLVADFDAIDRVPVFTDITPVAQLLTEEFLTKKSDAVYLIYNKFVSTLRQEPTATQFLPFVANVSAESVKEAKSDDTTVFEPSQAEIIGALVPRALRTHLYQVMLETYASEQSARMLAMKNATDNASDLVDDLSLTYNSARQAGITAELLDIAAGAAALA